LFGSIGASVAVLSVLTWSDANVFSDSKAFRIDLLFDVMIPMFATLAFLVAGLLFVRQIGKYMVCTGAKRRKAGRKFLVAAGCCLLFSFSCFYRSVNIADEGAAKCRNAPSAFNAPWAGRAVATFGEIALVKQIADYIDTTAAKLGVTGSQGWWQWQRDYLGMRNGMWNSSIWLTLLPVCLAECFSWSGVLSGKSRFYCAEYVVWCGLAIIWTWDAAELLHKSRRAGDILTNACLLSAGIGLFTFNAFFEIPHFFSYQRESVEDAKGIFECIQDKDSPLWLKRLPFFFSYFFGCSWMSVILLYRLIRGSRK